MTTTVCPQRILKEAIRLLELHYGLDPDEMEALDNNVQELCDLEKRLFAAGINKI